MAVDPPRRPGDLDRLDPVGPAEPEVEPRIGGGQVAAAADALGDLATAPARDRHPGADAVAVGGGPFEAEGEEVAARGPVVEIGQGRVLGDDQEVEPAVVVEVADGQPAADAGDRPGGAGRLGDVDQAAPRAPARSWAGIA